MELEESSSEDEDYVPGREAAKDEVDDGTSESGSDEGEDSNDEKHNEQQNETSSQRKLTKNCKPEIQKKVKRPLGTESVTDVKPPKRNLTGYIFFNKSESCNFKGMDFKDLSGLLASKWKSLSVEDRKPYMDMAAKDKERYLKEMFEFQKSSAGKTYLQKKKKSGKQEGGSMKAKRAKKIPVPESICHQAKIEETFDPLQIPIFTDRFLEFNRLRDSKLRQMRRANSEIEADNAAMSNQMKRLNAVIEKSEQDAVRLLLHQRCLDRQLGCLQEEVKTQLAALGEKGENTFVNFLESSADVEVDEMLASLSEFTLPGSLSITSRMALKNQLKKVSYPK